MKRSTFAERWPVVNAQLNAVHDLRQKCEHDYENPIRKGRAHYVCPKCGADISLELAMIYEANVTCDLRLHGKENDEN